MVFRDFGKQRKAETSVDHLRRECEGAIHCLAHFLLVSTFLEDAFRLVYQWDFQRDYIDSTRDCGYVLASLIVLINFSTQMCGAFMVAAGYHVKLACWLLGFTVVLQLFLYSMYQDGALFIRLLSLVGSLLLIYAEEHIEAKSIFPGLPSLGINYRKSYMQLIGRILVAFLFVTAMRMETDSVLVLMDLVGAVMMTLVVVGYRTKLSALLLALWLFAVNVKAHPFWTIIPGLYEREELKYEFFQNLSVIGGLLQIATQGPGYVSMDERRKQI